MWKKIIYLCTFSSEVMAPLIFASQQQFGFTHIAAASSAFGKVNIIMFFVTFSVRSMFSQQYNGS